MSRKLVLERREQNNGTFVTPMAGGAVMMSPDLGEEYWSYRVRLTDTQAVLGFPKYSGVGVGFAREKDYNVNLPYNCPTADIVAHILSNRGDDAITEEDVFQAVLMIQLAVVADRMAERRMVVDGLRDLINSGGAAVTPKMADSLGHHLHVSLREQAMLLAEVDRLTALVYTLENSDDGRAVLLESELNRATAELDRLKREGTPGVMHDVDRSFYRLTIAERDAAREVADRLRAELAEARDSARMHGKLIRETDRLRTAAQAWVAGFEDPPETWADEADFALIDAVRALGVTSPAAVCGHGCTTWCSTTNACPLDASPATENGIHHE